MPVNRPGGRVRYGPNVADGRDVTTEDVTTEDVTTEDVTTETARVVDRLRSMPVARLAAAWPPCASRAAGVRALAQRLADRAADLGGWPRHEVPDAGVAAVGDQLAVTVQDLLALTPPAEVLAEIAAELREMRLTL